MINFLRFLLNTTFSLLMVPAKILKSKTKLRSVYISLSNKLAKQKQFPPEKILLLLPHCFQISDCPIRITTDIDNCKRCGRCQVGEILKLRDKYGINVCIATGGSLARKKIIETRPQLVIAAACYRDLSEGIHDIFPMPVIGSLITRPNGPCQDTLLNLPEIEKTIQRYIKC